MTQETIPEPVRDGMGASIMGPHNVPVERENPSLLASPDTDAGTIPNLKFSFSTARNRVLTGGWSREVTVRELPIATTMAGVDMRLELVKAHLNLDDATTTAVTAYKGKPIIIR